MSRGGRPRFFGAAALPPASDDMCKLLLAFRRAFAQQTRVNKSARLQVIPVRASHYANNHAQTKQ